MSKYQTKAMSFRCESCDNLAYPLFGLYEETAELIEKTQIVYSDGWSGIKAKFIIKVLVIIGKYLGKWAKRIRKKESVVPFVIGFADENECRYELGDIHWMLADLDSQYGFDSTDVEKFNISKLTVRKMTNQIMEHQDH